MDANVAALEKAIQLAGSQAELARRIGKKQAHIWNWLHRDKRVPADQAIPIELAVDGGVKRHQLRSDIYPVPTGRSRTSDPRPERT